jgi:hypothetical protein
MGGGHQSWYFEDGNDFARTLLFDLEGTQVFYWLFKQSTNNCTAENVNLRCTTQFEFTCAQK